MIDLFFAISAVVLLTAPIALTGAFFVARPFGFGSWRGDPWPVGIQEEDADHAWGETEADAVAQSEGAMANASAHPPEAMIVELDGPTPNADAPKITRLHGSVKRAA